MSYLFQKYIGKLYLLLLCIIVNNFLHSQSSVYDNFQGEKWVYYVERGGVLDSVIENPSPSSVNKSTKCALYVRNGSRKFDNIKMALSGGLSDIDSYATYLGIPPHFKLKIYTTAPAGTLVEVLLSSRKGNNDYPAGTHSQYQAYTKKSNEWEELEFSFSQIPQGSETSAAQVDQIVLLFNPNSSTSDIYYFDDLTGPPLNNLSVDINLGTSLRQQAPSAVETTQPEVTASPTIKASTKKAKKPKK
jgi:hypothetical protein